MKSISKLASNTGLTNLLWFALILFPPHGALSSDEHVFSDAEKILWLSDQLGTVDQELELTYKFEKTSSFEPDFSDKVTFTITGINEDGSKAAEIDFFSGERNVPVPKVSSTTLNPIFKIFLQGDVYEMNRLTDPTRESRERWRYFQKRIKQALATRATVADVKFDFEGREYMGKSVVLLPFIDDPNREKFLQLSKKRYRFLVSDQLPGYLYKLETIVPGRRNEPNLIREVLSLSQIRFLTAH